MGVTQTTRPTQNAETQSGITPARLLAVALLGCLVAAVFGSVPLAAWVDTSIAADSVVQQAADAWDAQMQRLGLDQPYAMLRRAVRTAEAARFSGAD
jgi:hypothetical protein